MLIEQRRRSRSLANRSITLNEEVPETTEVDMGCMWISVYVRCSAGPDLSDLAFDEKPLQCLKGRK